MRALSLFLPLVIPYVPGCSDPMAEQALLSSCIEFCGRSLVVQSTGTDSGVTGKVSYDVEEPAQLTLVKVLSVFYMDRRLKARSREMVVRGTAARGSYVADVYPTPGTPTEWFSRDPSEPSIDIYPPPGEDGLDALTIVAAYQPTRAATKVPDTLYDDYAEDIANGAIARLLLMPAQPFTAPTLSEPYRKQFVSAVNAAATLARVGLGSTASRVQPGFFA